MEIIRMDGRNYYTNCLGYLPNAIERAFDAIENGQAVCYELMASIESGQYNINDELFAVLETAEEFADKYDNEYLADLAKAFDGILFNYDGSIEDQDDFYGLANDIALELDRIAYTL